MKHILIAIPTARYIEPQTFKSIYDLEIPEGYTTHFQFFYGYNVDQVRNLIAHWTIKSYDYLFSVDHDIAFPSDTLKKLLSADKPVISGIYRQRIEDVQNIEIFDFDLKHIDISRLQGNGILEVGACGFGCVLVKKEVFESIGYPYFKYKSAIDHKDTFSEDLDFCVKARTNNYSIWCDTSIICDHYGQKVFEVEFPHAPMNQITIMPDPPPKVIIEQNSQEKRLIDIANMDLFPKTHSSYLAKMKQRGIEPKVIYDIGSCVMHWTNAAKKVWQSSEYVLFEAMPEVEFLYKARNMKYCLGVLSDKEKEVEFYQNTRDPGGNSYYKENEDVNPDAAVLYNESHKRIYKATTLDLTVERNNLPYPDLIKIDVQGAELDVIKGGLKTIEKCKDLILELQHVDYNKGAPKCNEVISYLNTIGFKLVEIISTTNVDGDYHFTRI